MALLNTRLFLDALTPAGDFVVFVTGTQTDTEDQVVGRPYGVGTLYAPVAGGATQMQVACEENGQYGSLQPFRVMCCGYRIARVPVVRATKSGRRSQASPMASTSPPWMSARR